MMWKSLGFYEKGEQNMRYDFTKIIDRHGKDAIAVDGLGKNPDLRLSRQKTDLM